jgi:glycosyltransferase involved in cell wall biosynthesis
MTNRVRPLVTIGIPTFRRADSYLKQAIQCAVGQTYPDIEVIVSDNCSPDHTGQVVKSVADARIKYFRHAQNIGPNNNFNFCVEQASGDYFLLLQDDDMIDPDFVETCMAAVNDRTDVGLIRTGTRLIDEHGVPWQDLPNLAGGLSTKEFFLAWFHYETSPYLCSTLFNTRRLQAIGGLHSRRNLFQDVAAEVQLAARFGRVDVPDIKASFRKHPGEMTFSVKIDEWCDDSLYLLDLMCDLVPQDRELIRAEGMRFFARINYHRANAVKSFWGRLKAHWVVWNTFDDKHDQLFFLIKHRLPSSIVRVLSGARDMLKRTLGAVGIRRFQE